MREESRSYPQNLDAIVRELRWHRRAWIALAVLAGVLAVFAAKGERAADELRARRFVLVDPGGTVRATLTADAAGSPALQLFGDHATERLAARVTAEGPSLVLSGPDGKMAAKLVVESGVPRLALADNAGRDRLWLALRLGSPAIQFLSVDGAARSGFTTMNDDTGVAVISGAEGSKPGVALYDKDRKIVWSAP